MSRITQTTTLALTICLLGAAFLAPSGQATHRMEVQCSYVALAGVPQHCDKPITIWCPPDVESCEILFTCSIEGNGLSSQGIVACHNRGAVCEPAIGRCESEPWSWGTLKGGTGGIYGSSCFTDQSVATFVTLKCTGWAAS